MNDKFRIIMVEIKIIKNNISIIHINKAHIITKNVTLSESELTKTIPPLENTTS